MSLTVSTASLNSILRQSVQDAQSQLAQGQIELSTGRVADLALSLGNNVGRDFSLGIGSQDIQAITDTNSIATTRLGTTQNVLSSFATSAQSLQKTLLAAQTDGGNAATIQSEASTALQTFTASLNFSDGSGYIFGGINSGVAPMSDYSATPPSAAKQAVDQAFSSFFGFSQTSPSVNTITATQMQSFLSGPFSALFSGANWSNWSAASSQPLQDRISVTQTTATSVTANDPAMQKLAMAYTMVSDLGLQNLNTDAYHTVLSTAAGVLGQANNGLNQMQTSVGVMQANITSANNSMSIQQNFLNTSIGTLENVDQYQTSAKVTNLMTQIETAYTLTSKLQQLTLAKYL